MRITHLVRTASVAGAFIAMMATTARADIIFNTDGPGTGFNGMPGVLTLNSTGGQAATLKFIPNANTNTGTPSNVNYGIFVLACPTCTTKSLGLGASFSPFTFDLLITDMTDGATGKFVGTSSGTNAKVFSGSSLIDVNWSILPLGPGTTNALTGSFGTTTFTIQQLTQIVAPNSGNSPGQSTVQGVVTSGRDTEPPPTPEPATLSMFGVALIGAALISRRRIAANKKK